jgi:hypothetical protein
LNEGTGEARRLDVVFPGAKVESAGFLDFALELGCRNDGLGLIDWGLIAGKNFYTGSGRKTSPKSTTFEE